MPAKKTPKKATPKIGAVTFGRNAEKYIVQHLQMYTGVDRNVFVYFPNFKTGEPEDRTLALAKRTGVEIFIRDEAVGVNADLYNILMEIMSDCDRVIFMHADTVMSQPEWKKLLAHITNNDVDLYRLDMRKCLVDYYFDFDHGVRDCEDSDPIAAKRGVVFKGIFGNNATSEILINDVTVHHFVGWKGVTATKDWIENRVKTVSDVSADDLKNRYGGWISCPPEIQKMFKK